VGVTVREKRKGSGDWYVFICHAGKRRARHVGAGKRGKQLAETVAIKIQARLLDGDISDLAAPAPTAPTVPTFQAAAERWLEWYPQLFPLRSGTLENRRTFLMAHLIPFFGGRPISEITRTRVQDFIASRRAVGGSRRGKALSDDTIKTNLAGLRLLLDYFVEQGYLPANPMRGTRLWRPTPRSAQPDPFTQAELAALVGAAESLDARLGLMVRAWAQSGMRSGELRGLQRADQDPSTGEVTIQRTRSRRVMGAPKTPRSYRQVALTHPVVEAVSAWEAGATRESRTVLERLARVVPLSPEAPLFGSLDHPGRPMDELELHKWWARTVTRAQVRRRPPENLRHSWVSALLSRGAPIPFVARQAGHSPVMMLTVYAAWLPPQPSATQAQPPTERMVRKSVRNQDHGPLR
jgi:integrase